MGYERYPRGTNPQSDYDDRTDTQDYGRDFGGGRDNSYSNARDYAASGRPDQERGDRDDRYGSRDYGHQRYGQRDSSGQTGGQSGRDSHYRSDRGYYGTQGSASGSGGRPYGAQGYGRSGSNQGGSGQGSYGGRDDYGRGADSFRGQQQEYHGSYASDGRRFEDVGRYRHADDDDRGSRAQQGRSQAGRSSQGGQYGRQPQGYDYDDRGFFARAGDEVRSWFGDEDAERRRDADARYDERSYGNSNYGRDDDYHSWRSGQIASLDRDYHEYRQENRSKFENEFSSWRSNRQTQRDSLGRVKEHQDVVGSDGAHVGTVDKVRGDRILLTRNDADAGGRHHSIPSSWITTVDDKVTLSKTADEAKKAWRDEENSQAMFGYGDNQRGQGQGQSRDRSQGAGQSGESSARTGSQASGQAGTGDKDIGSERNLNSSFPGTY